MIIFTLLLMICIILLYLHNYSTKIIGKIEEQKMIYKLYYNITNKWLKNKNNNILIEKYLLSKNINNIAIYGIGELGKRLYEELKSSKINVLCFIDRNANNDDMNDYNINVINLNEVKNIEKIDAIIITPMYAFESIKKSLLETGINCNIIFDLDEIISQI